MRQASVKCIGCSEICILKKTSLRGLSNPEIVSLGYSNPGPIAFTHLSNSFYAILAVLMGLIIDVGGNRAILAALQAHNHEKRANIYKAFLIFLIYVII